jgi:hypothetical protein
MTTDDASSDDSMLDIVASDIIDLEERLEGRLDDIETRLGHLERRTDLLQLVDDVEQMEAEQRSTAILQHMQKKIQSDPSLTKTFLTRDDVEKALHYPDIDRTTFYTDMQRCERLVGDDDICWYTQADESPVDESVVYLNLEQGDLPNNLNGGA